MSSEQVYSTKQLADNLQLGTAMIRKYAVALEKLTGEEIPIKKRDGRQFSGENYRVIAHAKSLIDANTGLSVDTALKMALTPSQMAATGLATVTASNSEQLPLQAILEGLDELKAIRMELQALREQVGNQLPPAQPTSPPPNFKINPAEDKPPLLIRVAVAVDRWVKQWF